MSKDCPLDGHENQKYCSLVENNKANDCCGECVFRYECEQLKESTEINKNALLLHGVIV